MSGNGFYYRMKGIYARYKVLLSFSALGLILIAFAFYMRGRTEDFALLLRLSGWSIAVLIICSLIFKLVWDGKGHIRVIF